MPPIGIMGMPDPPIGRVPVALAGAVPLVPVPVAPLVLVSGPTEKAPRGSPDLPVTSVDVWSPCAEVPEVTGCASAVELALRPVAEVSIIGGERYSDFEVLAHPSVLRTWRIRLSGGTEIESGLIASIERVR